MSLTPSPLITFLDDLEDPRRKGDCNHKLIDILMIAICTIMSGGESWEDMALYGKEKMQWLKTFLELPEGIPSHDTFYRVFCLLDAETFQDCFIRWVKSAFPEALSTEDGDIDIIPIDGKAIKGSKAKRKGKHAVHMVSAWSHRLGMVLGQKRVDQKSNEITAIPELLEAIDLKGALITADAISCQKKIASTCIERGADYLLAVKGNQPMLQKDIETVAEKHWEKQPDDVPSDSFAEQKNTGHGRKEYRCCWVFNDIEQISSHEQWQGLKQFGIVQADRIIDGKATTALRLYITSKSMTAQEMLCATRAHWEVENNLHWMLDVSFNEDACQTRHVNAAENLSTLRRIGLNIFKLDKLSSGSIARKRKKAGWNNAYLGKLLEKFILEPVDA